MVVSQIPWLLWSLGILRNFTSPWACKSYCSHLFFIVVYITAILWLVGLVYPLHKMQVPSVAQEMVQGFSMYYVSIFLYFF